MVSVLAFYFGDPSSNPAGYLNFMYEEMIINEKEAGIGQSLKKVNYVEQIREMLSINRLLSKIKIQISSC